MLAGTATAAVTTPPMLVTKPWAPARRTWNSITSWTARSTSPFCSLSCFSAPWTAPLSGPTPTIARCSASRTNPVVSPGASSLRCGASALPTVCLTPMPSILRRGPLACNALLLTHLRPPTGVG